MSADLLFAHSRRSVPRFELAEPLDVEITGLASPARLLDLSVRGVRLEHSTELPNGTPVRLQLKAPELGIGLTLRGVVVWSTPSSLHTTISGVVFRDEVTSLGPILHRLCERRGARKISEDTAK